MKVDGVCGEQLIYFFSLTEYSDRVQHMRIWVINNRSETRSLNSVVQRFTSLIHTWKTVPNFKTHKTKFYFYLLLKLLILIGHIRKTFLSKNPKLALIQRIPLKYLENDIILFKWYFSHYHWHDMRYTKLYGECLSISYDSYNKHIFYKEMCITLLGNKLVNCGIGGSKSSQSAY